MRGHLLKLANRKTKRRYERDNLTIEDLEILYKKQNGLCAISGVPMSYYHQVGIKGHVPDECLTNISIDRIDNNLGYELSNIQLVCYIVNVMKSTMTSNQLEWWCEQIIKKASYK